jgi:hypothetical protein
MEEADLAWTEEQQVAARVLLSMKERSSPRRKNAAQPLHHPGQPVLPWPETDMK